MSLHNLVFWYKAANNKHICFDFNVVLGQNSDKVGLFKVLDDLYLLYLANICLKDLSIRLEEQKKVDKRLVCCGLWFVVCYS